MSIVDGYIKVRERSLNWILGSKLNGSLNPVTHANPKSSPGESLAGEIKSTLNQFKASAMDISGHFVDYHQLAQIPVYKNYSELISRLKNFDLQSLDSRSERLAFWINLYDWSLNRLTR